MDKINEIKNKLIEFDEQVGWNDLRPEKANKLAMLLVGEAVELQEAINNESQMGMSKYDVGLEVADVYIYLQKICLALDIDLVESIHDKMLINKARFLSHDYQQKVLSPKPRQERFYKITNTYTKQPVKNGDDLICGQLLGVHTQDGCLQRIYVDTKEYDAPEFLKQVVAIVIPRNGKAPIWFAADSKLTVTEIDQKLRLVDYLYDIELV